VRLLDSGIAKSGESTGAGVPKGTTLATLGTPGFMRPEQARGRLDSIDGRVDIWALGATMFALLTCRHVHEEATANEQLLAAMTKAAPPLRSVATEMSEDVAAIVDRALAFDREQRFPDAGAMKAAVAEALRARDVEPRGAAGVPGAAASSPGATSGDRIIIRSSDAPLDATASGLGDAPTLSAPSTDDASVKDVTAPPPRRRRVELVAVVVALALGSFVLVRSIGAPASSKTDPSASAAANVVRSEEPGSSAPSAPPSTTGFAPAPPSAPSVEAAPLASAPKSPPPKSSTTRVPIGAPGSARVSLPSSSAPSSSAATPAAGSVDIFNRRH